MSSRDNSSQDTQIGWRQIIQFLYPDALSRAYCVPPIYFNRVPYARSNVAGEPVLVLQSSDSEPPPPSVPLTSQPSGREPPAPSISLTSQPSCSETPSQDIPQTSQLSGSEPPHFRADQPSECELPSLSKQRTSQPSQNIPDAHDKKPKKGEKDTQVGLWPPQIKPRSQLPKVPDGHVQADFSQQHVLSNLKELGDQLNIPSDTGPDRACDANAAAMFIISELNFKDYLNKPFYAKETAKLPKPATLRAEDGKSYKQGDFDILVITRHHGILVGELKSVGMSEASQSVDEVIKKVEEGVDQVDKSEAVVRHLVGDIAPDLTVRKTLFLPYVSCQQLQRVLSTDQLKEVHTHTCTHARMHARTHAHTHT